MKLVLVGLSHKTAPLAVRECLAPPPEAVGGELERCAALPGVREAFLVSTCNRVEALAVLDDQADPGVVTGWLAADRGVGPDQIEPHLYAHQDLDAVRHLYRVASSLDSLVVGEPQILGQIKEAYRAATEAGTSRAVLNRLLHKTFQVAKRVRSETNIGGAAVSISFAAVELAKKIFDSLEGLTAMVVGAGEMAELALEHLVGQGVSRVLVANRTLDRAVELARPFGGEALELGELPRVLGSVDIVITSTGAMLPVISLEMARQALKKRRGRPLFFIDIAVPRDVAQEVGELDGCYLYDIDDLSSVVEAGKASRAEAAEEAERIVAEEVVKFMAWLKGLEAVPTISALSVKAEHIRTAELNRTLKDLGISDPEQAAALDRLTQALVKKLIHDPIMFVKHASHDKSDDTRREQLALVRRIFNIEENGQD
ncbi:MAG: glutamyl-tRNA reductase [Desulfarculaceae bacterium]|nr:glutamyl-tRNA reductase [Desulfarculaceae bacterium]MCF8073711.1 glutamyl-tRNA reductase [Desulfarculaceae bacterium]MCF8101952.1 glutamyl-tRNA reductase [Desulfarculaceae bacterium]MCF8115922.1 glutamyl-tRNA reductase [Desulfarculaceae bacterium]